MSTYTRISQMLIEDQWGSMAQLKLTHQDGRCLVWAYRTDQAGGDEILALATGDDHGQACSQLNHLIARPEGPSLTTQEAAKVLGITDGRVRQFIQRGRLVPSTPGATPRLAARFSPAEVHRFLQLPRHGLAGDRHQTRWAYAIEYAYGSTVVNAGQRADVVTRFSTVAERDEWVAAGSAYDGPGYREAVPARHPEVRRLCRLEAEHGSQVWVSRGIDD